MRSHHRRLHHVGIIIGIVCTVCHFTCQSSHNGRSAIEDTAAISLDTSRLQRFNVDCSIRAIAPIDEQTCWYTGSGGQYGYTENGGQTWTIDSLSHPDQDQLEFRSIAVTDESVFILSVGSPALLYKSDNKGVKWDLVYQEYDSLVFYDAMAFWDDSEGIAMGDPTDGCLSVIKTIDGGNTWQKIPCSNLPASANGEAAFAASNSNIALHGDHVWIVSGGMRARVFHSADRGVHWNVYDTPIVQGGQMTGIFSCDFYDEKKGIIFGGDWEEKEKNIGNKANTNDGGKTWSLVAEGRAPGYRSCVQYLDDDSPLHLMAVGIPGISYSSDGGGSWSLISNEDFYTFRRGGEVLWLAGRNKIAKLPLQ